MGPRRLEHHPQRQPVSTSIPYATLNLLFKHLDAKVAAYKRRQIKRLKQASEILAKTPKKYLKIIANISNIHMKHLQTDV
jgi:hypothetical protein